MNLARGAREWHRGRKRIRHGNTEEETSKCASNFSVMVRPDGDRMIFPRAGQILLIAGGSVTITALATRCSRFTR